MIIYTLQDNQGWDGTSLVSVHSTLRKAQLAAKHAKAKNATFFACIGRIRLDARKWTYKAIQDGDKPRKGV